MSTDTMHQQEASVPENAEKRLAAQTAPRLSELFARDAMMRGSEFPSKGMPRLSLKKAIGVVALGGLALQLLGPFALATAAAGYFIGTRLQKHRDNQVMELWNELVTQILATQQNTADPSQNQVDRQTPARQQTPDRQHAPKDQQAPARQQPSKGQQASKGQQIPVGQQPSKGKQIDAAKIQEPGPPLTPAAYFALHRASERTRSGLFRSALSFILNKFKQLTNNVRENHTIKGLQEKVFNLENQAAEINAHYDQQIAGVEKAVREGIDRKFDFKELESIEGKDHETIQRDKATAAALSTALEQYRADTNQPKAKLSDFLFKANEDPSLANKYQVPEHVMKEVAKAADSIKHQRDQIEGYRENALNNIEAQRAPAVAKLHAKLERQEQRREFRGELMNNIKGKLQAGTKKITGAFTRNREEAGFAR